MPTNFMVPASLSKKHKPPLYVRVTIKPSFATTCSLLRLPIPETIARSAHVVVSAWLLSKQKLLHDMASQLSRHLNLRRAPDI